MPGTILQFSREIIMLDIVDKKQPRPGTLHLEPSSCILADSRIKKKRKRSFNKVILYAFAHSTRNHPLTSAISPTVLPCQSRIVTVAVIHSCFLDF